MYQLQKLLQPFQRVLASASPRRQQILSLLGLSWEVYPAGIEETAIVAGDVFDTLKVIAQSKALAVAKQFANALIVAADTEVIFQGKLLGKPADVGQAWQMLKLLSGKSHLVSTAVAIVLPDGRQHLFREDSIVYFSEIPESDISEYLKTSLPYDKAGGYGVQDSFGAAYIEKIEGCFFNVMGFPLSRFRRELLSLFNQ